MFNDAIKVRLQPIECLSLDTSHIRRDIQTVQFTMGVSSLVDTAKLRGAGLVLLFEFYQRALIVFGSTHLSPLTPNHIRLIHILTVQA